MEGPIPTEPKWDTLVGKYFRIHDGTTVLEGYVVSRMSYLVNAYMVRFYRHDSWEFQDGHYLIPTDQMMCQVAWTENPDTRYRGWVFYDTRRELLEACGEVVDED